MFRVYVFVFDSMNYIAYRILINYICKIDIKYYFLGVNSYISLYKVV